MNRPCTYGGWYHSHTESTASFQLPWMRVEKPYRWVIRWNGYASSSRIRSPRNVAQRHRIARQVHEDEAREHLAVHLRHAQRLLVEVEELLLVGDVRDAPVEAVAPAVVLARELAAAAARLLAGVLLPHDLVAAVGADVVERVHVAVEAAGDDDRREPPGQLAGEVGARPAEPLGAARRRATSARRRPRARRRRTPPRWSPRSSPGRCRAPGTAA